MELKYLLLIFVALANFILGAIVFRSNRKHPMNIAFSLMAWAAGLWIFGIVMFTTTSNMEAAAAWARFYYLATALIVLAFVFFANYYIYPSIVLNEVKMMYLLFPFLIMIFIILNPAMFIGNAVHYAWGNDANENFFGHLLFAIYFLSYIVLGFKMLYKKYANSEGYNRINLRWIIWGLFIGFLAGTIFDLIMPLFFTYQYIWVGPYFSLLNAIIISYLVLRK